MSDNPGPSPSRVTTRKLEAVTALYTLEHGQYSRVVGSFFFFLSLLVHHKGAPIVWRLFYVNVAK